MLAAAAAGMGFLLRVRVVGDTPAERIECIRRLARDRPMGAAGAIAAAAADDSPAVRAAAVTALGRLGAARARAAVEERLADGDVEVRIAAARALTAYGDAAAAGSLARLAGEDESAKVREEAIGALGDVAAPEAIVALVEIMEGDHHPALRTRAALALLTRLRISRQETDPASAGWMLTVERIKLRKQVKDAFGAAGRDLESHPERLPEYDLLRGRRQDD